MRLGNWLRPILRRRYKGLREREGVRGGNGVRCMYERREW